ncbi:unnamed protein product, partial [Closterium sp. NIES-54]
MMEKFFSFMSFYEQHQQGAPAQSNNSNNNNATPMSLDSSSYARGNQQQPTFAPYEPQRGSVSFMPRQQPSPEQEKTLDALQVQSRPLPARRWPVAGPLPPAQARCRPVAGPLPPVAGPSPARRPSPASRRPSLARRPSPTNCRPSPASRRPSPVTGQPPPVARAEPRCLAEPRRLTEPHRPAEPRRPTVLHCPTYTAPVTTSASAAATAPTATMASPTVLTFDAEGREVDFDVWVDDLQHFLQCDSRDGVSLFDHTSGASTAPTASADSTVCSQWTTRDAVARLAVRSHLPPAERAHFGQYKTAHSLYDAVAARYSSPTTAALSHLMLPYLFPYLAAFATVPDLVAHLRTSDARYRTALPTA